MAQTDTRPGFRLPWSSDRADSADPSPAAENDAAAVDAPTADVADAATDNGSAHATQATADAPAADPWRLDAAAVAPTPPAPVAPPRAKPNKFLADLTKAMQATAEAARTETMERFTADAKSAVERVHAAAAEEAAELRRLADEDVSGIRDWSKAQIAGIREETERRISGRKADLEHELEGHGSIVETRIGRVDAFVSAFEAEMAAFYDRLFAEEDPTRFAGMAEQLPEAPSLDLAELDDGTRVPVRTQATAAAAAAPAPVVVAAAPAVAAEPEAEPVADAVTDAAIETPATTEETPSETAPLEVVAAEPEAVATPEVTAGSTAPDDFAAAEAEAAAMGDAAEDADEDIPVIADEVLAARIAGLVPDESNGTNTLVNSKVVVSGLVSVASIAGFKRHLARMVGVASVGVSSGPDGEFIFTVSHMSTTDIVGGITSLPGFEARVTAQTDDTIAIAARDPESQD